MHGPRQRPTRSHVRAGPPRGRALSAPPASKLASRRRTRPAAHAPPHTPPTQMTRCFFADNGVVPAVSSSAAFVAYNVQKKVSVTNCTFINNTYLCEAAAGRAPRARNLFFAGVDSLHARRPRHF